MSFLSLPLVMLFYMWGGQTEKWIRPVGTAFSLFLGYLLVNHIPWTACLVGLTGLSYGLELSFGYGTNSIFNKMSGGIDWLDRLLYSIWCCIPVIVACILLHHIGRMFISIALLICSFQVHAGTLNNGWKLFGKYDILIEDIYRSLAIGLSMDWAFMQGGIL